MGESPEATCGSFLEVDVGSGRPPLWWEAAVARREESLELLICVKCYGGGREEGTQYTRHVRSRSQNQTVRVHAVLYAKISSQKGG